MPPRGCQSERVRLCRPRMTVGEAALRRCGRGEGGPKSKIAEVRPSAIRYCSRTSHRRLAAPAVVLFSVSATFSWSAIPLPGPQINLGCLAVHPLAGETLKLDRCSVAGSPIPKLDRRGQTSRLRSRCAGLAAPACALLTVLAHRFGIMDRCVRLAAFHTRKSCRRGVLQDPCGPLFVLAAGSRRHRGPQRFFAPISRFREPVSINLARRVSRFPEASIERFVCPRCYPHVSDSRRSGRKSGLP